MELSWSPSAPYGYDVHTHTEVIPKPPPIILRWTIGPVIPKLFHPVPGAPGRPPLHAERLITVQLTADQQVSLSVTAEDAYGNPVDITGATAIWSSSDGTIVDVVPDADSLSATAVAVGPVGTAAITVANQAGSVQGSLAIDVIAGEVAEIVVTAGTPEAKP